MAAENVKHEEELKKLQSQLSKAILTKDKNHEVQIRKLLIKKNKEKNILKENNKETKKQMDLEKEKYTKEREKLKKQISSVAKLSEGTIFLFLHIKGFEK